MATVLVVSTYGSDDPTRATLPFLTASPARKSCACKNAKYVTPKDFAEAVVAADKVVSL